jgi:hypothetical protein
VNPHWIPDIEPNIMDDEPMMNPESTRLIEPAGYVEDLRTHGFSESLLGTEEGCTDQVVGDILSGWRYDLSAVSSEVLGVYVEHLTECRHCRARQRLHRTIDVVLLSVFTVSIFAFLLATMIIHRGPWAQLTFAQLHMRHLSLALTLQTAAVGGLLFSLMMWILVAIATPAPGVISHTVQQRRLAHSRQRAF